MTLHTAKTIAIVALACLGNSFAQEDRGREGGAPVPVLAATDEVKIRSMEGKEVKVTGFVESTKRGGSGVQILCFKDSEFTVVCFKSYIERFKEGEPADIYEGKTVEVSGKLEIYQKQDQPQIKLREPSQIVVVGSAAGKEADHAAKPLAASPLPAAAAKGAAAKEAEAEAHKKKPTTRRKGKSRSTVDFRKYFSE